ncbi:hypothetical protein Hanom_Chr17g01591721 [Helianthus anomalus]
MHTPWMETWMLSSVILLLTSCNVKTKTVERKCINNVFITIAFSSSLTSPAAGLFPVEWNELNTKRSKTTRTKNATWSKSPTFIA